MKDPNRPKRHVFLDDDDYDLIKEISMEFHLTYSGPLHATQRDSRPGQPSRHNGNKHHIRRVFHEQLKRLWETSPALGGPKKQWSTELLAAGAGDADPVTTCEGLAARHAHYGYNFVPLVTEELDLLCSVDIVLLRPDRPGDVLWAGDIDNRLKTLFDAMRIPDAYEGESLGQPAENERPLFVFLESDQLLSRVAVETDRLLEPVPYCESEHAVRLFVKVTLKPFRFSTHTMHLA